MIINGAKYGTSLFIYIHKLFEDVNNNINMNQENFIKPLNKIKGKKFNLSIYNKSYTVKLNGYKKKDYGKYDVKFTINNTKEYTVYDIKCEDIPDPDVELFDSDTIPPDLDDPNLTTISSELPGKLIQLNIDVGDKINVGDQIATISAMKMEFPIHSHVKGVVRYINTEPILPAHAVIAHILTQD